MRSKFGIKKQKKLNAGRQADFLMMLISVANNAAAKGQLCIFVHVRGKKKDNL